MPRHRRHTKSYSNLADEPVRAVSVARVTEISSTSPQSFEDAVKQGIDRATKTLRGVTAAWIQDQRVMIRDGKAVEYQVNLKITFVLEG
jgi:dodecin